MKYFFSGASPVPHKLTLCLCWLFAVLYAVWLLPNTVFVRNFCLIAGSLLSLPVIFLRWRMFFQAKAIPIWMIAALFLWVTIHLFFIGQEHFLQQEEFAKSWKKIIMGSPFALGLGFSIASNFPKSKDTVFADSDERQKRLATYWKVIYVGFMLPILIYFIKLGATAWARHHGVDVSPHLIISREIFTDPFAIPRAGYVFFVMPALTIAIVKISIDLKNRLNPFKSNLMYLIALILTLILFYVENDRLAFLFSLLIILLSAIPVMKSRIDDSSPIKVSMIICLTLIGLGLFSYAMYRQNTQWNTFLADAKIAIQVDRYDNWKYAPEYLPVNELGQKASDSNYKRIAWLIVGSRMAFENPLGYGLMSQSFGRIGVLKWPDSQMSWSHSAWLDITLGYGFPALILFLGATFFSWINSRATLVPLRLLGRWGLGAFALVFMFKEVSSEVYVNAFIFLILFVCSLTLFLDIKPSPEDGR